MGAGGIKRKLGEANIHTFKIKKPGQNLTELDFFGSPARTPFGYAQGKLTADFSIKDNFFLRDHPLI